MVVEIFIFTGLFLALSLAFAASLVVLIFWFERRG